MRLSHLRSESAEESLTSFYLTFSDLMVLLGVFFVMLLSISKIETGSFERFKSEFTGSSEGTLVALAEQIVQIVEGEPGVPGVNVVLAEDGVRLNLDTASVFDTGSAQLKQKAMQPLDPILEMVVGTEYRIDVEGHSDDVPLFRYFDREGERSLETNWSLSGRRAASLIHHLLDYGFDSHRIRLVGYASTQPILPIDGLNGEALEAARAKNRRVSLLIR